MNKKQRIEIWNKYSRHCAYCGKVLKYREMEVDHFIPKRLGWWFKNAGMVRLYSLINFVDAPTNLMPSCRRCNHYKRADLPESFRQLVLSIHKRVLDTYIGKVSQDYGVLNVTPWDGLFYFEKVKEKE